MRTCIQTFGINGEVISKPHVWNRAIKGMMMKERSIGLKEETAHHDQSKKILERLMDDKIFIFDSDGNQTYSQLLVYAVVYFEET